MNKKKSTQTLTNNETKKSIHKINTNTKLECKHSDMLMPMLLKFAVMQKSKNKIINNNDAERFKKK